MRVDELAPPLCNHWLNGGRWLAAGAFDYGGICEKKPRNFQKKNRNKKRKWVCDASRPAAPTGRRRDASPSPPSTPTPTPPPPPTPSATSNGSSATTNGVSSTVGDDQPIEKRQRKKTRDPVSMLIEFNHQRTISWQWMIKSLRLLLLRWKRNVIGCVHLVRRSSTIFIGYTHIRLVFVLISSQFNEMSYQADFRLRRKSRGLFMDLHLIFNAPLSSLNWID